MSSAERHADPAAERLELVERFFAGTGSSYDFVVNAATFGIDRRWKRIIVDAIPAGARRILDLACGTGILTFRIARRFPRAQVVGVELRAEYLAVARRKGRRLGASNVQLFQGRAEDYLSAEPFDAVVSSYLAKYADLERLAGNARALLREGGLLLMHDFTYPPGPILVRVWRLYFALLQRLGTPLLPGWRAIFYGLPQLIAESRWTEELERALAANGFRDIAQRPLTLHGSAIVSARR